MTFSGTAAQHPTNVVGSDSQSVRLVDSPDDRRVAVGEPGHPVVQSKAQGVEDGALARSGGAGDGEETGAIQWRVIELDRKISGEAGKVRTADGQDLHEPSCSTDSRSSAKAAVTSRGGSSWWLRR